MLAAGNKSLSDTIKADGDTDAPTMRIMELPVESSGDMRQSELIRRAEVLSENAGWAGDAYLRYLLHPAVLPWVRDHLPIAIDNIMVQARFRREHRFWARALASIQIAALLVEKAGIITFSSQRIMEWAIGFFAEKARDEGRVFTMLPTLAQYINDHQGELLHMPKASRGATLLPILGEKPRYKVNIRVEEDTKLTWIATSPFRQWLEKHAAGSFSFLMTELKKFDVLKDIRTMKTLTAGSGIPGGMVECFCVEMGHPIMSGMLREVDETDRKVTVAQKLARL